jgi:hypothetical protein
MNNVQLLRKALNIALAELREVSKDQRLNSFDDVMRHYPDEVRRHIRVDMSPVYWDNNDYDPEYVARMVKAKGEIA